MKRYVIFAGDRSYARGGAQDYIMDFSRKDHAESYRHRLLATGTGWCHVWDTKTHTILPQEEEDEHGFTGGITGER